ncbi:MULTISPECIES: ribonucleoside-diphosphate reductase subunit alpha [Acidiphilium]|jgi:ribonucleoside-diphosphate reductase alpha chain|uniref:Ribonucleoside-diphosphate reductase n=1 Tax=Acidiphilium multivorum (strain DSM 11245 / JCM 8867 / NBRC 100883 / AIU 301) TaxID=926570 RepID=F0IX70_ACIMA|nr:MULTISPECIES: ribonucleoside-diphosphate reductase subunit alpha [Acidiphilium]MBU6356492.1 ribonucleoside-diphosphate reductase subunit alpha [Rhodospirillales bacterium]EGO94010.1 Ribonucleotide-diphosphate reductase subunit alpha [Acidiphilium sp. PM]MBS3024186.1 ribonucleoside-diphosphate reductase subunit alpha [Acidiphilium multivorum]BAJ80480.1 ribonucleoside-diphosphate reductase alpha subunit [Acidiphilium multivorum AIU301]GAN73079.1 ribonucleotide-diphosphate reductase subunit al
MNAINRPEPALLDTDVQIRGGYQIRIDRSRDSLLTEFGRATLNDRYLMPGESYQDLFARVASYYGDDAEHAQRLYDYISKLWFMPATPVLSNGGTKRGLPISCFLNEASDSLEGIVDLWNENVWLASKGGGIGSYWGNLRSIGEKVGQNGKTSGVVPFIRVMDSLTLAISQGSLRRGSAAVYLPISHPEVEEFIEIRRPTGGDPNRKALNLHHGILVSDAFMRAVEADEMWALTSPKDGAHVRSVSARSLWIRILTARIETGEPYIIFADHVNNARPEHHKLAGLEVKTSNLCAEITLPTGLDHHGQQRTAVCCLSSINLETWLEWHDNPQFIEDVMRFLDNVLQDFIDSAPDSMARAKYAAMRERSVGLGVMGFHSLLQSLNIPFESAMAKAWNIRIFRHIRAGADAASRKLAEERGPCPDAAEYGVMERFSHKMAIAPTASISIIAGNSSPGIEPIAANVFLQKTLSGSFSVRNRHLQQLLAAKGRDDEETWSNITVSKGSVQHLDFLTDDEKAVFKTAFELDQRWVIEHAADRTPYICQSQSINVFLPANVHKRDLHQIHFQAWKKGVKSLYYCRSLSIQRADTVSEKVQRHEHGDAANRTAPAPAPLVAAAASTTNYEECLACQ